MKPVEQIRSAVDIVQIVGDYVKLRKRGLNLVGYCPFHQEKTPSFSVHPARQIFHCFGCGVGGDVFKFVMLIENLSFPEAVERVAEKAGIQLPAGWGGSRDEGRANERTGLYKLHEIAAQFFASQLAATVEGRAARAYLLDRGLGDETLATFWLGYAPANGQALARHLSEAGFAAALLEASGLLVSGRESGQPIDRFRRRVIFPIVGESGKVVAFAGRALGDDQPKYLNSPETPIYCKSRVLYHLHRSGDMIRKLDSAILVEGYMDCIALVASGVGNVVASCGTSLTESQIRLLGRYTRRVIVNYDPDSAGIAATERSLGLLLEEGFEIRVVTLPDGMDPDAYIRRRGAEAYRGELEKAPAYLDYLADRAATLNDVRTPEGKVRAANAVLPYLAKVRNPLLRDEMASHLAERLRLDERLLRDELKRAAHSGAEKPQVQPAAAIEASPAEKELLRAFLENSELAGEFLERLIEEGNCNGLPTEGVFKKFLADYKEWGGINPGRIEESLLPGERRILFEMQFCKAELLDRARVRAGLKALRRRRMERERASLQAAIERAERGQDREALSQLIEAKLRLVRELAQLSET